MGVAPRDIPITRADVTAWLDEYNQASKSPNFKTSQRDFFSQKINGHLTDTVVNTEGNDSLEAQTDLIDLIMADLPSYG